MNPMLFPLLKYTKLLLFPLLTSMNRIPLIVILLVLISCSSHRDNNSMKIDTQALLGHEWVEFDVNTGLYMGRECINPQPNVHVIINNRSDSTQALYLFVGETEVIKITPTEMVHIMHDYRHIYTFPASGELYDDCIAMALQSYLDYFPMYYPSYDDWRLVLDGKVKRKKIEDSDTVYLIKGKKMERHCYADGYCKMKESAVIYRFSTKQGAFVEAQKPEKLRYSTKSKISNIHFDDQSNVVDSVFNIASKLYEEYDKIPADTYYYVATLFTTDTVMTDTVLDWPIVNLATGDTTTLRRMEGSTLLYLFNFNLDSSWYAEGQGATGIADTLVWLMPLSNNTERLQQIVDTYHLGRNIYYTKGFTQHLSNEYRAYLIDKNHHTAACFNQERISLKEWIEALKKAKTP